MPTAIARSTSEPNRNRRSIPPHRRSEQLSRVSPSASRLSGTRALLHIADGGVAKTLSIGQGLTQEITKTSAARSANQEVRPMSTRVNSALSLTALVIAIGGATPVGQAAWDAVVPRNSVGTPQLKRNAVNARQLAPNAV